MKEIILNENVTVYRPEVADKQAAEKRVWHFKQNQSKSS